MKIVIENENSVGAGSPSDGWRSALRTAVRSAAQLLTMLELPPDLSPAAEGAGQDFPLFAPLGFIARMTKGNPHDPLLLQVLPQAAELVPRPGFTQDAVGDLTARRSPGLLHKYNGRALFITTGACAVHCRYCFRRHFPYHESPRSLTEWEPALQIIADDPTLEEIILSGGDPLTIVDATLAELVNRLAEIPHVRRLRVHTRLPIMIPERVTADLIDWLRGTRLTPIMVIHTNHAQEIDEGVAAAIAKLVDAGIPVLNQAVLLRGINDSVPALADLSRRLIDLRVMPYYLHQLDRVQGAAHFEVPIERGQVLVDKLRRELPGYAIPRYVQDAGDAFKRCL